MKLHKFDDYLHEKLCNNEFAAVYLEVALEDDGVEELLYALRGVAIAQGGVRRVAEASQKGRESLYKSLSRQGNPRVKTLDDILRALGMRLSVTRDMRASQSQDELTSVAASG